MSDDGIARWDERYAAPDYLFGREPSQFLRRHADLLRPGQRVLAVADGEGRNGVWLARRGLEVTAVDGSAVALAKARELAGRNGVAMTVIQADLSRWTWPQQAFDVVVAIFIQFADPALRTTMFAQMKEALVPGGLLLLHGYRPEQVDLATGGPPHRENMYTTDLLERAFADFEVVTLEAYNRVIEEGTGHAGMSALIDLVARRPAM
ncbi:MAG: class I SAM-dependent methyltransferase [Geminicoccaceae bacterium]|nr:class I SAM-dependent methyltransferase [Geminicoccaceae bacterium]